MRKTGLTTLLSFLAILALEIDLDAQRRGDRGGAVHGPLDRGLARSAVHLKLAGAVRGLADMFPGSPPVVFYFCFFCL